MALAYQAAGERARAVQALSDALTLAEPGGFIRTFIDEGPPMAALLAAAAGELAARPGRLDYLQQLQTAFEVFEQHRAGKPAAAEAQPENPQLIDALSPRELEVLKLIAQGLSNQQISKRLFLALNTVKGHNRVIFEKLQVQNRTEAVARARELGLL